MITKEEIKEFLRIFRELKRELRDRIPKARIPATWVIVYAAIKLGESSPTRITELTALPYKTVFVGIRKLKTHGIKTRALLKDIEKTKQIEKKIYIKKILAPKQRETEYKTILLTWSL